MFDLGELYHDIIFDHNRKPRNFKKLEGANRMAEGYNPLCGDQVTIYVYLEDEVIREISFQGSGCAISKASASMMTESLKGKTIAEAKALFDRVHKMLIGEKDTMDDLNELGELVSLSGVCNFPNRVKCASLAWHTLNAALNEDEMVISTE
ncbi:MAG: SUF system NifU family Fe-S cluster assembly protein [Candidatus Dadabacteria bacterium]